MKRIALITLALGAAFCAGAQTNAPAPEAKSSEVGLRSDFFRYLNEPAQLIYTGNVQATNAQGQLTCGQLTIHLPGAGAVDRNPTNAVAVTNVVIVYVNDKGETNRLTCDKAIYDYGVANGMTNQTFTFTGHATNTSDKMWMTGEPLVWDNINQQFSGVNFETHFKAPAGAGGGTNMSPLNLFK